MMRARSFSRILAGLLMTLSFVAMPALAEPSKAAEPTKAIFAGGCFWCMESEFKDSLGVSKVVSGYTGGHVANPSYEQVSSGTTGHVEAVEVTFDPAKTSYANLLDIFWSNVDPLDAQGQFCDKGTQYHAGIFTLSETQKKLAAASRDKKAAALGTAVATVIEPAGPFYPAEDYHQGYAQKNRAHYQLYRLGCGRDARLDALKRP